jgi:3-oxoacyl-[acyl-carrier protein] reductase
MFSADLKGRRALVTGGASGIGLACVTQFAQAGAKVAANHLPGDPAGPREVERLRGEGLDVIAVPGNVALPGDAQRMVRDAIAALGGLDYLVNNAGTPGTSQPIPPGELDRMSEEFWQTILNTNLVGTFRCAHAAAAALSDSGGAIVNVASIAGFNMQGSSIAYAASKAGVVSLTKSLARALGPAVRVNAVAPGAVNSPWQKDWGEDRKQQSIERSLLKRRCEPDDIAEVVFFLCAGARMVTGETVIVDGGLTL